MNQKKKYMPPIADVQCFATDDILRVSDDTAEDPFEIDDTTDFDIFEIGG